MDGKDDRELARHVLERVQEILQHRGVVDVRWAMQRDDPVAALLDAKSTMNGRAVPPGTELLERVDHHVADEVDLVLADPLAEEVLTSTLLRDEQKLRDRIGQQSVDLFRHGSIVTAEPGLDVGHRNLELRGRDRCRQRRVHVTHHEDHVGALTFQDRLESLHDLCRLVRMGAGPDFERDVRRGNLEVVEELAGHRRIVVLARMDEQRRDPGILQHTLHQRRNLDEVGSSSDDVKDLQLNGSTGKLLLRSAASKSSFAVMMAYSALP